MQFDKNLIKKLQKLSMIELNSSQEQETMKSLQEILNFTKNLDTLDTSKIQDNSFRVLNNYSPLREDILSEMPDISNNIINNAPKKENNFFVVPKIIE
jgi:aspartyl-tRNA(Asn)/glutamyl-tRNA(Gln) amidotransferase subunit C